MRPKRFDKLRRIYIAKYEVTASDFGFVNLEQNCASISQCGSVAVAYRSGSTRRSNQMPSQLLGDAKEPSGNLLCLIRRRTSATCRDCLRESSGSAYLGHFRMVTAIASDPLVIYALSTTRQVEYIVRACIASLACSKGIISIPGKICAPLIVDGPMPDTQITEENELALETFLTSEESELRSVHEQLTSITVTQNCIGPTHSSYQRIQSCLMCFARETGGFAVLLRMEVVWNVCRVIISMLSLNRTRWYFRKIVTKSAANALKLKVFKFAMIWMRYSSTHHQSKTEFLLGRVKECKMSREISQPRSRVSASGRLSSRVKGIVMSALLIWVLQ